ncbi:PiggyBac transposable element-derived protein 4 [Plakobranchus ocellatus]|uniref:PiggyBac transposable element-derived protein 4 n=1 Tax=Plakobranchus ocellatus TaxID=259542 RepID=A0AAV3ZVX4_9GAST|nr:PiggyBac transposable element-derived protein 4 [Plakobranchus ocellatus]
MASSQTSQPQGNLFPICIDEMVVGHKGRWVYEQFNATKPDKYHIKSFGLVESKTGYVLNVLKHYGSDTAYSPSCDPDSGIAMKIFDTLTSAYRSWQ